MAGSDIAFSGYFLFPSIGDVGSPRSLFVEGCVLVVEFPRIKLNRQHIWDPKNSSRSHRLQISGNMVLWVE